MDKTKRKGKPKRRRLIILVLLIVFSGCMLTSIVMFNRISNPHYRVPILSDIKVGEVSLVEARLLEYVTIGESSRADVEVFGDEYLSFAEHSCPFTVIDTDISKTCYLVDMPMAFCNWYYLEIVFLFNDEILSDIDYGTWGVGCL